MKRELLEHPAHGVLPARRLLECIFALTPAGRIEHYHVEQVDIVEHGATVRYILNDAPAADERRRCQIIPPLVTEFGQRD